MVDEGNGKIETEIFIVELLFNGETTQMILKVSSGTVSPDLRIGKTSIILNSKSSNMEGFVF